MYQQSLMQMINQLKLEIVVLDLNTELEFSDIKEKKKQLKRTMDEIKKELYPYGCEGCEYTGIHVSGGIKYICDSVIDLTQD